MLVCNSPEGRRWFVRGPDVPDSVWPTDSPGSDSIAVDLLRGHAKEEGPADVYVDTWIDGEKGGQFSVKEDSVRITSTLVLSLLWWENESFLLDLLKNDLD